MIYSTAYSTAYLKGYLTSLADSKERPHRQFYEDSAKYLDEITRMAQEVYLNPSGPTKMLVEKILGYK